MDGKTIGHKLRALRGEMDAKTVADALGISTSALFMYERGERIPRDQICFPAQSDPFIDTVCLHSIRQGYPSSALTGKKLFEQLKSENVSFSDAERIISLLSASVKTERDDRII